MSVYRTLGALVLAGACCHAFADLPSNADTRESVIILERSPCFGTCPSFRMVLFANGDYIWEGRKYVAELGVVRGKSPPDVFRRAVEALEAAKYNQFNDNYIASERQGCREWSTDSPTVQVFVQLADVTKGIHHYHGCRGFPREAELTALEEKLDEILQTKRWIRAR